VNENNRQDPEKKRWGAENGDGRKGMKKATAAGLATNFFSATEAYTV
jgi:hypothetical protein